jgi:hypothetical protein
MSAPEADKFCDQIVWQSNSFLSFFTYVYNWTYNLCCNIWCPGHWQLHDVRMLLQMSKDCYNHNHNLWSCVRQKSGFIFSATVQFLFLPWELGIYSMYGLEASEWVNRKLLTSDASQKCFFFCLNRRIIKRQSHSGHKDKTACYWPWKGLNLSFLACTSLHTNQWPCWPHFYKYKAKINHKMYTKSYSIMR